MAMKQYRDRAKGVWIARSGYSTIMVFEREIDALRWAAEENDVTVQFVQYGEDIVQ